MEVENREGKMIEFKAAVEVMDTILREKIHMEMAPCSEQEFFSAYELAHEKEFGTPWFLSSDNPVW